MRGDDIDASFLGIWEVSTSCSFFLSWTGPAFFLLLVLDTVFFL